MLLYSFARLLGVDEVYPIMNEAGQLYGTLLTLRDGAGIEDCVAKRYAVLIGAKLSA